MSSTTSGGQPLLDRADVHKSCKTIELIVNLLNDYSEATNAVLVVHRKLFRALKDASQIKGATEAGVNAFLCSGKILEAMLEVDAKFSKIADKECETITSDVRKWFKKLSKEEKAHDERVVSANAKIKSASQAYEKAAKKKNSTALEEHTRYMNVISTVGPEISQDKYNHAVSVTQQQTTVLLGVCAALLRVVDAEWLRTCETVKRCSPGIGALGRWKTFCEANWGSDTPPDLPDPDAKDINGKDAKDPGKDTRQGPPSDSHGSQGSSDPPPSSPGESSKYANIGLGTPPRPTNSRRLTPLPSPTPTPGSGTPVSQPTLPPPPESEFDPSTVKSEGPGFNTLTSAFPAPPTHTPSKIRKSSLTAMNVSIEDLKAAQGRDPASSPSRVAVMKDKFDKRAMSPPPGMPGGMPGSPIRERDIPDEASDFSPRRPTGNIAELAGRYNSPPPSLRSPPPLSPRSPPPPGVKSQSTMPFPTPAPASPPMTERNVLGLNGTLTAEPESMSSSPTSVSTSSLPPLPPPPPPLLPSTSTTPTPQTPQTARPPPQSHTPQAQFDAPRDRESEDDPTVRIAVRRKRIQELQELQWEEQDYMLKEQERALAAKAEELERERAKIRQKMSTNVNVRGDSVPSRKGSLDLDRQQQLLQMNMPSGQTQVQSPPPQSQQSQSQSQSPPKARPYRQPSYSFSYTQIPSATSTTPSYDSSPSSSAGAHGKPPLTRQPRSSISGSSSSYTGTDTSASQQTQPMTPGHALDCHCPKCYISRASTYTPQQGDLQRPSTAQTPPPPQPLQLPLQPQPIKPDKPKGWIRRLSIPVLNSSNNDSSKKQSQSSNAPPPASSSGFYGSGSGVGSRDYEKVSLSPPANEHGLLKSRPSFESRHSRRS